MRNIVLRLMVGFLIVSASPVYADIQVHTSDFIPNQLRTNFNSFEALPATPWPVPPGLPGLHVEDGVRVEQIGQNGQISNGRIATLWWWSGNVNDPQPPDGVRSWYPSGGDNGYTRITRDDYSEIQSIGFMRGSGIPELSSPGAGRLYYQLFQNGGLVLAGDVPHVQLGQYLGFYGGGFDEIRVRDGEVAVVQSFYDGTRNALALDAIELANVPEPSSLILINLSMVALVGRGFHRRVIGRPCIRCAQSVK